MNTLIFVTIVAALGGIGAIARFLLSRISGVLPWGILLANILASVVADAFLGSTSSSVSYAFLVVGFAGGLSTFSSWAAQTGAYWQAKQYRKATYNAALNLLLPAAGVVAGAILAYTLLK